MTTLTTIRVLKKSTCTGAPNCKFGVALKLKPPVDAPPNAGAAVVPALPNAGVVEAAPAPKTGIMVVPALPNAGVLTVAGVLLPNAGVDPAYHVYRLHKQARTEVLLYTF